MTERGLTRYLVTHHPRPDSPEVVVEPDARSYASHVIPPPAAPPPPNVMSLMLHRRWKYLVFCGLVSVALGVVVAERYSEKTYTYSGSVLYNRTTIGAPHYVAPDTNTLSTFVKSPETLKTLYKEFALDKPLRLLDKSVEVQIPRGSGLIEVRMQWQDRQLTKEMLDRLLELFVGKVDHTRKQVLERIVSNFQARLSKTQAAFLTAKAEVTRFQRDEDVIDVEQDLSGLRAEVTTLEQSLNSARLNHRTYEAQFALVKKKRQAAKKQSDPAADGNIDPRKAAALLEKRNRLNQLAREQKERNKFQVELAAKRKKYEHYKVLYKKQYMSAVKFEEFEAELEALEAQESDAIRNLEGQMAEIDGIMPAIFNNDTLFEQMTPDQLEQIETDLELQLVASQGNIDFWKNRFVWKRKELLRVNAIRHRSRELKDDVEIASAKTQQLETQLATFERLLQSDISDSLTTIQPATASLSPPKSNWNKLFLGVCLAATLVMTAPTFLQEFRLQRCGADGAEIVARRLGLAVLCKSSEPKLSRRRKPSVETDEDNERPRLLALRIQQSLTKPGSIILFSSLSDIPTPASLLGQTAECFARRGERVILIDIGKTPEVRQGFAEMLAGTPNAVAVRRRRRKSRSADRSPEAEAPFLTPGLANFLASPKCELHHIVLPSKTPGVDCMLSGSVPLPPEGLGTARMTELLERLREQYTLILIAGPTSAQPVDLEMLAARVDRIVFNAMGDGDVNEQTVRDLVELDAPILGVIT